MAIKKLVAVEQEIKEQETFTYKKGEKYTYFQDPQTGKFYQPKNGFEVTCAICDDLGDLFVEVEAA